MTTFTMQWLTESKESSRGYCTHRLGLKWSQLLQPGDTVIMQHILPKEVDPGNLTPFQEEELTVRAVKVRSVDQAIFQYWHWNHADALGPRDLRRMLEAAYGELEAQHKLMTVVFFAE